MNSKRSKGCRLPTPVLALGLVVGTLSLIGLAEAPAHANPVADFYNGKQMTFIISSGAGGGYDTYSRTVGRHLGRHIPGNPTIVPQNMPGAGGLRAGNFLFNAADRDGSVIGGIQNNVPFVPLTRPDAAQFDPQEFNWLGSPNGEVGLLLVWHTVPVHSMEDLKTRETIVAATGAASTPAFYGRLINEVFGARLNIVSGYQSQTEAFLAIERGESEGFPSTFWSSLKVVKPEWIAENKVRLLIQYADRPHPELPDVPFGPDLVTSAEDRELFELAVAPLATGRPYLAPPGVPADRVAALRAAMMATFNDPEYIADAERQRLETGNPSSGEELEAIIRRAFGASDRAKERLRAIDAAGRS